MNLTRMDLNLMKQWVVSLIFLVLAGCGGGGGGSSAPSNPTAGSGSGSAPTAPTPSEPSAEDYKAAAVMLDLATFGATDGSLEAVAKLGPDAWLDEQFDTPPSYHLPIVYRYGSEYGYDISNGTIFPGLYRRFAFFERAFTAPDQLRQLTAYALSQILVVSDSGVLGVNPVGLSSYYDTLLEHSFGNYRDLLLAVTLHPSMGFFLSHVNNAKTDTAANTFPDENYAREVMQLFSIGLYELNPDGSQKRDVQGNPVATYDNEDIQEFAKIFTGLAYDSTNREPQFGRNQAVFALPMVMFDEYHEPGEKYLLNGQIVSDGQTGLEDIDDAIDNLFNHPNVGPFVGRQLIQRLVTSNPSPEYIARISAVFADNGDGVRGDMKAVVRAILTDEEIADASRVREPFRRYLAAGRALNIGPAEGYKYGVTGYIVQNLTGQMVLTAPSVFNFYSPFYRPQGGMGLISPEMQITTEDTAIGITNLMANLVYSEAPMATHPELSPVALNLEPLVDLVDNEDVFFDQLDRLFFAGNMSDFTRAIISEAMAELSSSPNEEKVKLSLYLSLISPEQAVFGGVQ